MLAMLSPGDVGAELHPEPVPGRDCGPDDAVGERPLPGGCFFLQSPSRATRADQVGDLMERYEVAHLTAYRWHTDQTPTLSPKPMHLGPATSPERDHDAVRRT